MTSHLGVMVVFAACVSAVFGVLLRDVPRDQGRLAARIFLALTLGALVVGWGMYLFFG
jgi:hypothetical protein